MSVFAGGVSAGGLATRDKWMLYPLCGVRGDIKPAHRVCAGTKRPMGAFTPAGLEFQSAYSLTVEV
jgi:hypothetical protein